MMRPDIPPEEGEQKNKMDSVEKNENTPMRLDSLLVARGLVQSRERAKNLIKEGVLVDGKRVDKADAKFPPNAEIKIEGEDIPWVSRGGLKLERAFELWQLSVQNAVCLDIGASTGGFTDVLLAHGARKVYALDVGHDQLAEKLRQNSRVVNMEGTHIGNVKREQFAEPIDFICIDVSFISLDHVLPTAAEFLNPGGQLVALIKPEFEMGKKYKSGVVRDPEKHLEAVNKIKQFAKEIGLEEIGLEESPILGGKGNKEFLIYLKKSG
ncbi:MAG: TlyA family RNA methyltransferase [Candidatus Vogelbacteria bacterium]|nr:TlyA family RNA methyltransferase [Candidatus Vogelbacteria bacterium]